MGMAPEPQTYFRDESDSDVAGFVVIENPPSERYRVTENRESGWCAPFWMPEGEFRAHTHADGVEEVGQLPDKKFEQVVSLAKA